MFTSPEKDKPGSTEGAFPPALRFMARYGARAAAISAAILIPCFWHRRIFGTDLGSHLYNAWLARLAGRGQTPGLWVAHQWTNELFDYMLSGVAAVGGYHAAEMVCVSLAVLVFFWGVFALVCAATGRAPWLLLPCLALATYGWTFQMGFFNYYLSIGLSFWGVAILWRGRGWERAVPLLLAPFITLAHPLGLLWMGGATAYVWIADRLRPAWHALLLGAAVGALGGVHFYLGHRYIVTPGLSPFYFYNGADQLVTFGERYELVMWAFLAFVALAWAADALRRRGEPRFWKSYLMPAELYVLIAAAVVLLPSGVHLSNQVAPVADLTERVTSVSIVLLCCLLGTLRKTRWHLAGSVAIACIYFAFFYQDTGTINRMEAQIAQLDRTIPPNQRVLATVRTFMGSRVPIQHIADRACIGYCFSYGNYEPSTGLFRVRATPGNAYALSEYGDAVDTEEGSYVVQPQDLPVYQIYQCSSTGTDLCITQLHAGEENNALGQFPDE